nr:Chain G, PROTEIN (TNF-R2) [synthetic construct]1CA9_H Chain H, PROTEIN (TNF-R2) [synthetic construct]
GQVPFSKEEC